MMLTTAIRFKEAFPRYSNLDQAFQWVVSPEELDKVENVNQILAIFNEITNIVSGSDYPTSNMFLPEIWRMKKILSIKSMDRNGYIRAMATRIAEKFDKYWGECNLSMSLTAVLNPRFKMKLVNLCFPLIYQEDEAQMRIDTVLAALCEYYEVYLAAHNSSILRQTTQDHTGSSSVSGKDVGPKPTIRKSRFLEHVRSTNMIRPVKTNLDIYLEEDVYILENDENGNDIDQEFEALAWWKVNALKYRILSNMA